MDIERAVRFAKALRRYPLAKYVLSNSSGRVVAILGFSLFTMSMGNLVGLGWMAGNRFEMFWRAVDPVVGHGVARGSAPRSDSGARSWGDSRRDSSLV